MKNLTEHDKALNTYSNYIGLRIFSVIVCLFSLYNFPKKDNKFFYSYYDHIMNRDIFRSGGDFWKQLNTFMIMSYVVAIIILVLNAILAKKERCEGVFSDIVLYGYLTLLNPIYVLVSMIGSKAGGFRKDAGIKILVIPMIYFFVMLIFHIRQYRKNKYYYRDEKANSQMKGVFTVIAFIQILVLILLPGKNIISAVKMSKDYSSNYGCYKARPGKIVGIDEDTIGNRNNNSFIWDDKLHIISDDKIYVIDENEKPVERYNPGVSIKYFALYSNGTEDVLYIGEEEKNDELKEYKFNIYSFNLRSEKTNLVYSEECEKNNEWIRMFAIKDDYLYYMFCDNRANGGTIYRFKISEHTEEQLVNKELYVSNIRIESDVDLVCIYNYDIRKYGRNAYQPYKGAVYYGIKEQVKKGEYINRLYRKDYNSKKNKKGNDIIEEITPDVGNAQNINIYKDKIYFSINGDKPVICCMNLDGSDYQVLEEVATDEDIIISAVCVSDDYIVYKLWTGKGNKMRVIKR
ncbi:hypothetical protein SAMN05660484_01517 [Eubacterium ruminantium]|uniref:DUF5050 domain-containing protein n=3 Tax=Eubacteriaceae TaxID=186806 RepID=A0A1T4N917_9FIRM|nr:hypothetical protein [Eubacterium ruminantium]SCW52212.1 hypothetical protein SAMN05660484_01517 [Eubacterium ruminantium]SDM64183.1 hypothetical protein SAMN04490370_10510 [Eubacterium ruminantium]SJZ75348.1 hypothetical protein SAMN02745110_01517 [Eubacterium ruminantium]